MASAGADGGEREFMEKLENIRRLLSQGKSEGDPDLCLELGKRIREQSDLARDFVYTHDLPLEKMSLLKELIKEFTVWCGEMVMKLQQEKAELVEGIKQLDGVEDKYSRSGSFLASL